MFILLFFQGMAWDAALRYTKVKLQLLSQEDMYLFVEKGIRGGISTITKRLATANNPKVTGYDPLKKLVHLLYVDANNLYGKCAVHSCLIKLNSF